MRPAPMTLFEAMGPIVAPTLEQYFGRRDLCILAARVAIDVAAYFGVHAEPMPVQVTLYNESFARHVADEFAGVDRTDVASWGDDSWSVGIGCGLPERDGGWDGHLIAVANGWFGDFSIQQAERLQHNIVTGPAVVGPVTGSMWKAVNDTGTAVEYRRIDDDRWRRAPDWKDAARRRQPVGKIIRAMKEAYGLRPAV
jgi:hypothetical protein